MIELTCTNGEKVLLPVFNLIVKSGKITTVMSGNFSFEVKESYDDIIAIIYMARSAYKPNEREIYDEDNRALEFINYNGGRPKLHSRKTRGL